MIPNCLRITRSFLMPTSPLTQLVHPHDKPTLLRALTAIILSGAEHVQRLSLRVQTTYPDHYIRLDARFRYGTQGTHCTMWTE